MTVSIGAAALVVTAIAAPPPIQAVSPAVKLSADSTAALIVCGTTCPTPDDYVVDTVMNQFITPTHPNRAHHAGQGDDTSGVVARHRGPPPPRARIGAAELRWTGGPAWPDEPWWKLSGLFDLTYDQSIQAGVADLEAAMAELRQRPSGDLRLLARRDRSPIRGEAQARRAVPGGNQGPRHRLRAGR